MKSLQKLRSRVRSIKGFSLIEVLIALGLISIIGTGIAGVITNANKQQKGIQAKDQQREVTAELRSLLSDSTACLNSFGGGDPSGTTGFSMTVIKDKNNTVRYDTNSANPLLSRDRSGLLQFVNFNVADWDAPTGNVILRVKLSRVGDTGTSRELMPDLVTLRVKLDGAGKISECFSIGSLSDSFWKPGTTNISDIFFNAGNVGIGTSVPAQPLHISSNNTQGAGLQLTNTNLSGKNYGFISSGTASTGGVGKFHIYDFDTPRSMMVFDSSGNVGIGTTNPVEKLSVVDGLSQFSFSGSSGLGYSQFTNMSGGLNITPVFALGRTTQDVAIGISTPSDALIAGTPAGDFVVRLASLTQSYTLGSTSAYMTVKGGGNVGIGTTTPLSKFDVKNNFLFADGSMAPLDANRVNFSGISYGGAVLGNTTEGGFQTFAMGTARGNANLATGSLSFHNFAINDTLVNTLVAQIGVFFDDVVPTNKGSQMTFATASGAAAPTEKMRILGNGNVGIGTTAPLSQLSVGGVGIATSAIYGKNVTGGVGVHGDSSTGMGVFGLGASGKGVVGVSNTSFGVWGISSTSIGVLGSSNFSDGVHGDSQSGTGGYFSSSSGYGLIVASGNVGIGTLGPTERLDVAGNVAATAFLYSSDERLKKDVQPLTHALENILSVHGVSYNWRNPKPDGKDHLQIGVIAQQVRKVYPEAVEEDSTGFLKVNYPVLIAPMIEALRSLYDRIFNTQLEVAELAKNVTQLQLQNRELANRLDQLEQKMTIIESKSQK